MKKSAVARELRQHFERTRGKVIIRHGHEIHAFTDFDGAAAAAMVMNEPWLDLVTDEGEAIGFFVRGDARVVEPEPSISLEDGMIYLIDGDAVPDQPNGEHLMPMDILIRDFTGEAVVPFYLPEDLDIKTPASDTEIELSQGRSRNEMQGKWKAVRSSYGQFADFLLQHQAGEKDGACFLQGLCANGHRKSAAQVANYILGVDLDSGAPLQDVIDTITKHGLEATIYTTHSHLKDTSVIKRDHFFKWSGEMVAAPETCADYLQQVKGVLPHILEEIEIIDDSKHTEEGIVILVRHKPMPKFRAIFPLKEPFVFAKRGGTQQDAMLEWKERYAGFCSGLDFFFDEKCVDPARLFYGPRHPKGSTSFGAWHIVGTATDLDKFDRVKMKRRKDGKRRAVANNAFSDAGEDEDDRDRYKTEDGFNLVPWAGKYAKVFEIEQMLEEVVGSDFIRDPRTGGKMGVHVECPFEAEHSSFGGQGTYVINASDNDAEGGTSGFTFHCVHNACSGRDRLDFLREMIDQGIIFSKDLQNKTYHVEIEDDGQLSAEHSPATDEMLGSEDEEAQLCYLNERYAVVRLLNKVVILCEPQSPNETFGLISERDFKLVEKNRIVRRVDDKGKITSVLIAEEWLKWEKRRNYKGIGFHPDGKTPNRVYNSFNGWPVSPRPGDWSLLQMHLFDNICEGDQKRYDYLITWTADIFQNPAKKPGVALVLTGEKGTGKSKFFELLRKLLGYYAIKVAQANRITGNFNAHLESKLLLIAEEVNLGSDSRGEGILKDLITSPTIPIERKGYDLAEAQNLIRIAMISNDDWVVRASFGDERRYFVLRCGKGNQRDHAFFAAIDEQMDNGGFEAMLYDMLNFVPVDGWQSLHNPPTTPYLVSQQHRSLSAVDKFFVCVLRDGFYEPSNGDETITLSEDVPTEISALMLRAAILDYLANDHPLEKAKAGYDSATELAAKWWNAARDMRRRPGATNGRRTLIVPPLSEARAWAKQTMGVEFEAEPLEVKQKLIAPKAFQAPMIDTVH
jgi:hypothetical protein